MQVVWTIFLKELKSYFKSPLFYTLAFIYTTFLSVRFLPMLFTFASIPPGMAGFGRPTNIHQAVFMPHINWVYLMMLFLTPLITMRLFAEEKRERTLDLLLTAPISSTHIVIGKFLAAWASLSFLLVLAFLYPLSTGIIAEFDHGVLWSSYLGMFLLLGINCALGMFASTLTSSSMLAAFLGVLFTLAFMLMGTGAGKITHPFWSALAEQLALVLHIQNFFSGTIEISGFVFMVSSIALFCFFSQRVVESSRWR